MTPYGPNWLVRFAAIGWRLLVIFALVYAIAITIQTLDLVLVPVILAVFITAILHRPIQALKRMHMPRALASALGAALFLTVWMGTLLAAGLIINGIRSEIADTARQGLQTLRDWMAQHEGSYAGMSLEDITSGISPMLEERSGEFAGFVVAGAAGIFTVIAELVLAAIIAFFLLRDGQGLTERFLDRLPDDAAERIAHIGSRMWARVEGYLRGIAITALVNATLYGIALYVIDVPFVVPIMFITFVGSFIPYAGPIFATALAALVAMGHGGGMSALWVLASGFVIQQIEGNLLHPFVVGHAVRLPPVLVLVAVTTGATVAGLMGAFVAVPFAAALDVLFEPSADSSKEESLANANVSDGDGE